MAKWVWTDSLCCEWGVEIIHLQQVQCCSTRSRVSGRLLYMQVLFTLGVHFRSSPEHKSSCKRSKGKVHHTRHGVMKKPRQRGLLPVEIVEEGEQVEGQLTPAFFLTEGQDVGVHDGRGVVQSGAAHHGPAGVPATEVLVSDADAAAGQATGGFLTSRRGRPAAVGSGRGWATRPRRRTSRRRRNGWGTPGGPAARSRRQRNRHAHENSDFLTVRLGWRVRNVVKRQELKAGPAEPQRNWVKGSGGSGRLEIDSWLQGDGARNSNELL